MKGLRHAFRDGLPVLAAQRQCLHGVALHELGVQGRVGRLERHHVHPGRLAVNQDKEALLTGQAGKLPQVLVDVFGPGLEGVLHGPRGRGNAGSP